MEKIIKELFEAIFKLKQKTMPPDYIPPEIPDEITPDPSPFKWGNKGEVMLSIRQICDQYGLNWNDKAVICATLEAESDLDPSAIGKPNKDGTQDFGLAQFNNGKNFWGVPYWIGKGADFASVEEVLKNPEKNIRIFIREYKKYGYPKQWYGYKSPKYFEVLPKYISGAYKNYIS